MWTDWLNIISKAVRNVFATGHVNEFESGIPNTVLLNVRDS
jgi:hypothetical protein